MEIGTLVDVLKANKRHNKTDMKKIQDAHDCMAAIVDCAHCGSTKAHKASLAKMGSRKSSGDMAKIKEVHDGLAALGAVCMAAQIEGTEDIDSTAPSRKAPNASTADGTPLGDMPNNDEP